MSYEVICEVCRTQNLSKAAKNLNYSQSAVSQTVHNFEKNLGITLFERSKNGVTPLPGVMPIIESLENIAKEEKKIKMFAQSIRDLDNGTVRIGCLTRIATKWFPDVFREFSVEFPNIHYELTAGSAHNLQNNLRTSDVDFAFVSSFVAKGFAFTPIVKDELVVVLPKGHRLAKKKSIDLQDLEGENMMITSEGFDFEIGDSIKGLSLNKTEARYSFNDDIIIMKFVELGFGVCVLPRLFLDVVGKEFDMEIKSFTKKYYRTLGIAYPNKEYMTPVSTKFIDYLLKWFKANDVDNTVL